MQIVLTLDDSINFIEAVGMAEAFEAGGEYPWCKRADVRSFACGERTPEETGSASLQPTTEPMPKLPLVNRAFHDGHAAGLVHAPVDLAYEEWQLRQ